MTELISDSNYLVNDYFVIRYDHNNEVLLHEWQLEPTPEEFKNSMKQIIAALKHFKTSKVVWDTTLLGGLLFNVQQWIAKEWLIEAIESGYTHAAFVVPDNILTKMSVEETVEMGTMNTAGVRKAKCFGDVKSALEWICKQ